MQSLYNNTFLKMNREQIAERNRRIEKSDSVSFTIPGSAKKGIRLGVKKANVDGRQRLVICVVDKQNNVVGKLPETEQELLTTIHTPMVKIGKSYNVDPESFSGYFDPASNFGLDASVLVDPAGDEEEYHKDMYGIGQGLIDSFSDTVYETESFFINKDHQTEKMLTKKKHGTKKDPAMSKEDFRSWFTELVIDKKSPYVSHCAKYLDSETADSLRFGKKLFSKTKEMMDTDFDYLLNGKIGDMRKKIGYPCRYAPPPIYLNGKQVSPEDYSSVAQRLPGSIVYFKLGANLFTNDDNKVCTVKLWILHIVVAHLAEKTGSSESVIDVSCGNSSGDTFGKKRPASSIEDVLDVAESVDSETKKPKVTDETGETDVVDGE